MNSIKRIILSIISILISQVIGLDTFASSSFSHLETKITSESNKAKVTKMQLALKDFGLYSGKIDWNFKTVESSLLKYQKNTWLIVNNWDYWAGYFWVKTLTALKKDFPHKFIEVTERYLQMEKPSTEIRYFYITAYYSPLPNQKKYSYNVYKWRYRTFSEEKILQWDWKKTASWKKVFQWILAAPRNYQFWTKIEFEWIWVWVVEDRWWAIVNSWERLHEYDRIDIWMWYWEQWLTKATKWWKRRIKWKVVPNTRIVTIEFWKSDVLEYSNLKIDAEKPKKENVIKLQKLLTKVEIYNWVIDWQFSSIKDQLIKYQVDNNIINSKKNPHAGYFWNKTYVALREEFWWDIFKNIDNILDQDIILSKKIKTKLDILNNKISYMVDTKYWKDTVKAIKYRRNLRNMIDKHVPKIKNELRKKQLQYLKSLI